MCGRVCQSPFVLSSISTLSAAPYFRRISLLTFIPARMVLNYKKIAYTTEWSGFQELGPRLEALYVASQPQGIPLKVHALMQLQWRTAESRRLSSAIHSTDSPPSGSHAHHRLAEDRRDNRVPISRDFFKPRSQDPRASDRSCQQRGNSCTGRLPLSLHAQLSLRSIGGIQ